MPVKYLSPEWIDAYNATVAADESVRTAMKGRNAVIQMLIAEGPDGEIHYWLRIGDGSVSAALGDADNAEVTISQSYDTAAKVNSGELDGQKAFTQGKVKIKGKMMKMMQLRGPLAELQKALDTIETEY
jgi:putative sterol carrier protein